VSTVAVEAAARFALRPGFELVAFREVGLPLYRLSLLTVVMVDKALPALQEFALRSIEAGFTTADGIAEFLGLDERDLDEALYVLLAEQFIAVEATPTPSGADSLALSQRGRDALAEFRMTRAEERTYTCDYDGLLRRSVRHRGWAMRERSLRELGGIPIPPSPIRRPVIRDLDVHQVEKSLREARALNKARQLLEIVRIARSDTVFLPATMLVFRASVGDEVQAAFVIDGRLSEEHARAFAEADGPARLGLLTETENSLKDVATAILGSSDAKKALKSLEQAPGTEQPSDEFGVLTGDAAEATYELLETFDHPRYLDQALESATSRLIIVSPWIRARVVNAAFISRLREILRRGVDVYIGFGIGDESRGGDDPGAVRALERLSEDHPNLVLKRFGDTHAKVLICDEAWAIVTSFNWLSFVGDPDRTFRDERGMLVRRSDVVHEAALRLLARFKAPNGG
jgi:hypothetical protein